VTTMFQTFQEIKEIVRNVLVHGARKNFETHGEVKQITFLFVRRNPETLEPLANVEMLPAIFRYRTKEEWRFGVDMLVNKLDAVAIVIVSEVWALDIDPDRLYEDMAVPVRNHPDRYEEVMVRLEHESGNCVSWRMRIRRDGVSAELDEPREEEGKDQGLLTGFFPKSRVTEVEA
jgi:hypothetical protein